MTKNIKLFYTIRFLETLCFTSSIWAFFFTTYLTFSFGQALFILTIVGVVSIFFEIPSGIWADRFGRKKMYILGTLLIIFEILIRINAKSFFPFMVAGIIAGIGNAIISGNLEALIHDELDENKEGKKFKNIVSNSYISIFLGRALATSISGILFVFNPILPVFGNLISTCIILFIAFFINEPKQILSEHNNNLSHFIETKNFLLNHKEIITFIIVLSFISGIGNIYYFTEQPYLKQIGFNVESIGIIFAIGAIFSAIGSFIFKKISNFLEDKQILNLLLFMTLFSSILFIIFNKIYALISLVIISIMFGFVMSFGNNFLINKAPKNQKSTILSFFSFSITITYSIFNIIISFIIDKIGLGKVYFISIILVIILFIFNLLTFNRYKGN